MNIRKSDSFIGDVERQFEWYVNNAGWDVAERYLNAIAATCQLLSQHPKLGPQGGFVHPRLREWRYCLVMLLPLTPVMRYSATDVNAEPSKPNEISRKLIGSIAAGANGISICLVFRPFSRHILFYELCDDNVVMRRTMPGQRDLPRRLLESPETE